MNLTIYLLLSIIALLAIAIFYILIFKKQKSTIHNDLSKDSKLEDSLENNLEENKTTELVSQKKQVEQLLKLIQKEIVNISHEFKMPLALILEPAEKITTLDTSQAVLSNVETIQRNASRLMRMVDQLLKLESLQVNAVAHKSVQDFKAIIELVSDSLINLAAVKGVEIKIDNVDCVYFEFAPDALETILLNLISNAIKCSSKGQTISISAKRSKNHYYIISVKDSGIGIAEKDVPYIFDRFQRVLTNNGEASRGAGIGLALVKEIVELHDGKIELETVINEGSHFKIHLPILGEATKKDADRVTNYDSISSEIHNLNNGKTATVIQSKPQPPDLKSDLPTILVIEDDLEMLSHITERLSSEYNCMTATNGKDGVELAKEYVPDIVISDVMIPILDGYLVTKSIKEDETTSHIPVILISVLNSIQSRMKGWAEKADAYFPKPIEVDELKIRVQNLLEIRALTNAYHNANLFKGLGEIEHYQLQDNSDVIPQQFKNNQQFLDKLEDVISLLYQDSDLKIDQVASDLCMSQRQLLRKLKNIAGITPVDYLRRFRLAKAKELLAKGTSASRVAFDVGFSSHSHFGKIFKNQYGYTPSEYSMYNQFN